MNPEKSDRGGKSPKIARPWPPKLELVSGDDAVAGGCCRYGVSKAVSKRRKTAMTPKEAIREATRRKSPKTLQAAIGFMTPTIENDIHDLAGDEDHSVYGYGMSTFDGNGNNGFEPSTYCFGEPLEDYGSIIEGDSHRVEGYHDAEFILPEYGSHSNTGDGSSYYYCIE